MGNPYGNPPTVNFLIAEFFFSPAALKSASAEIKNAKIIISLAGQIQTMPMRNNKNVERVK